MSNWKLIVPESTVNLFTDPSFALADPDTAWTFAGDGTEDFTRGTAYSFYGFSSALADLGGGTYADIKQTITTAATSYTLSCMVRRSGGGVPTASHVQAYFDDAAVDWDSITSVGGGWYLCVKTATATAAANEFGVRAKEQDLLVDGMQLEAKAYRTTFCDGSREGCSWNGAENTSTSSRSAQSRAGGRVYDFEDDFSFKMVDWTGWGVPPNSIGLDSYAMAPGAQVNAITTNVNLFVLVGFFQGSSMSNLHALRQALVDKLSHDRYPQTSEGWQPVRIWYTGSSVWKEAKVFYDSGLEGGSMTKMSNSESIAIRFLMPDPFWYEIGDSAAVLDSYEEPTFRYAAGKLLSTGQWDDLGLTADPATGGSIYTICPASSGLVYFGGDFTHWGGVAERDYIAAYNPATDTWSTVGANNDFNGIVYDIKEGPDGKIYACGAFTDCHGVAAADYIAVWDGSAWAAVGAPVAGAAAITSARQMAFDSVGDLYVVGEFTNWADVAAADYIAKWDVSAAAWVAVGAPSVGAGFPYSITIDSANNIVIGGSFTNFAGDADADYIARWNGTAWADLGSGAQTGNVVSVLFGPDDILYLGGDFTNQGGDADCDYMCAWNGASFLPMVGTGAPTWGVRSLAISPDGKVWNAGLPIGGGPIRYWNGTAWGRPGMIGDTYTIAIGRTDPVIPTNYDIWIGLTTTGTNPSSGSVMVTNDGTAPQYPVITAYRDPVFGSGGYLYITRNETTGKELQFNAYGLLRTETLTVDCRPGQKSITSSFFGLRPDAILPNCDFGSFALQPGSNQITAMIRDSTPAAELLYMVWRDAYRGID